MCAKEKSYVSAKILSNKVVVWFGLISYPLYLWHWPLLTIIALIEGKTPSIGLRIFLIGLSILLSWLLFEFLEKPVRSVGPHEKMKVLNLYAGIGGNRKLWTDVEVTAVEMNKDIAGVYQKYFPDDKVIVGLLP